MEKSYCLCGQPYDANIFMIQCDACKDWLHSSCCNLQEHVATEIDKYHCPRCIPLFGPSTYKSFVNWHRHDYWDEEAASKPVQTGTGVFIRELLARHFASEGEIVIHMRGQQVTENLLQTQGFNNPIVFDDKEGLDMTVPSEHFSLYDVESYIGGHTDIDVIDVTRQCNVKMKLRDFVEYYNSVNRTRVFNVVSLEFSNTSLSSLVEAPLIARKLDWATTVWPDDFPISRPHVQKYCLMSVKNSYTDFHIDFGGTSVWYHVLKGEKIFYLIRPTPANLTLYQQWMTSSNQSETFFGDQVDRCYKCVLRQGQTMIIPTGWIHAVLTPVDSLVFGGNFLQSLNIPMQLMVYEIEKKVKTSLKYRYPNFELINWFAALNLLHQLTQMNVEDKRCPNNLLTGLKALLVSLKQWNSDKDYSTSVRDQIPFNMNAVQLLKNISREVRHAERLINQLNPPKPERESKRKRRKPVNRDFVDYSPSSKSNQNIMPQPAVVNDTRIHPLKLTISKLEPLQKNQSESVRFEETTTSHKGRAVLKFKFGSKRGISNGKDEVSICNSPRSIYDFHDDVDRDENCYVISSTDEINSVTEEEIGRPASRNGIESLLKASALATGNGNGRTSPSTQEAIAGMLSIGETYIHSYEKGDKNTKKRAGDLSLDDGILRNVHQDDDFVYPPLDNSDDEDLYIFKPRGRSKIDEAWNPKARLGPLTPKTNRPTREGTRKESVEKVLEAAAAKRANDVVEKEPKRQYRRKKCKLQTDVHATCSPTTPTIPSSSSSSSTITHTKPKKGMKTVKQRLGKILKIHKMIH